MSPEEFENRFGPEFAPHPTIDPHPYGPSVHYAGKPVKTGLTTRGKAALTISAAAIATTGLLGWQHYSAGQAAAEVKAKELSIEQQKLDLERIKALGEVNQAQQKTQTVADAARQKRIDACVQDNKGLVGKQLGATYRSVLEDCQAQYPATTNTGDMQAAASASDTNGGGGGLNPGLLIGAGVLGLGVVVIARKGTRSNPA